MKILTIPGKMSNTGTIHDIARQDEDRVIEFRGAAKYAVILASYYGGKGYTTHVTAESAAHQSRKMHEYSHEILDSEGNRLIRDGGQFYDGSLHVSQ